MPMQFPAPPVPAEQLDLRKKLLRVVLRHVLRKHGIPAGWVGGETKLVSLPTGEVKIEVQLSVQCDEPRLLTYLSAFQAEFQRRLVAIEPDAMSWISAITWQLALEPAFEPPMPRAEYWENVQADRDLTAREKGLKAWDPDALARQFVDTQSDELVVDPDFDDTERGQLESDLAPAPPPPPPPRKRQS